MKLSVRSILRFHRSERGQVLVLTAVMFVALLGMTGLATDVGLLMKERRDLQNAADAAALAAVQELPGCSNTSAASAAAQEWAQKNEAGIATTVNIDGSGGYECDTVHVQVEGPAQLTFLRLLGIEDPTVTAQAAARIGSLEASRYFMPWGLTEDNSDCLTPGNPPEPKFGESCVLKVGAGDSETGDHGALDLDGGGGSGYRDNIIDNTTAYDYGVGDPIDPLTGNKVGPTGQGIEERLSSREPSSYNGGTCDKNENGVDDFSEVFDDYGEGSSPRYAVRYGCENSPRLIVIPILDQIDHPTPSIIKGWALMYLESYACVDDPSNKCNGKGHWEVSGTMVDAVWSDYEGFFGTYRPGQPAQWGLVE